MNSIDVKSKHIVYEELIARKYDFPCKLNGLDGEKAEEKRLELIKLVD